MSKQIISRDLQPYFRKWLRYYIDFCKKYRHAYVDQESQSRFLAKLKNKGQSKMLRQQAKATIDLCHSGHHI